jgi:hypothetical protein
MKPKRVIRLSLSCSLLLLFSLLAGGDAAVDDPRITNLNPSVFEAFTPLVLELEGGKFIEGSAIYIETSQPGRFIKYEPDSLTSERITLRLSIGFGLRPKTRDLYVETEDGCRSNLVQIQMVPKGSLAEEEATTDSEQVADLLEASEQLLLPVIHQLQPDRILLAQPLSLLIIGEGFVEGAEVWIMVNNNIATAKAPVYRFMSFACEYLADTLLQVDLAKGFYSDPQQRELYVVNPDGGKSNRLAFTILSELEK